MKKRTDLAELTVGLVKPDDAGPAVVRAFEDWLAEKARHEFAPSMRLPSTDPWQRCDVCGLRYKHAIHRKDPGS